MSSPSAPTCTGAGASISTISTESKSYGRVDFYAQSKFANVLFALELHRRLQACRSPIRSLLAHPGYSATNLQLSGPTGILKLFMRIGNRFMAQSVEMGALNQLYAATAERAESGQFIGPDGKSELKGYPSLVQPVAAAQDATLAKRLWLLSEELTGFAQNLRMSCSVVTTTPIPLG